MELPRREFQVHQAGRGAVVVESESETLTFLAETKSLNRNTLKSDTENGYRAIGSNRKSICLTKGITMLQSLNSSQWLRWAMLLGALGFAATAAAQKQGLIDPAGLSINAAGAGVDAGAKPVRATPAVGASSALPGQPVNPIVKPASPMNPISTDAIAGGTKFGNAVKEPVFGHSRLSATMR